MRRRGLFWAVLSPVAYSASAILGKNLLRDLRASDMLFWRFTIAVSVLWAVLAVRRSRGGPRPHSIAFRPNVGLGVLFGFMSLTGFIALGHLDASIYIVVVYLYVAMVAAASPLFGHPVNVMVWPALAVTVVGIVLTVPDTLSGSAQADWFGIGLTLFQALLLALYTLAGSRVVAPHADGMVTMGWSLVGSWLGMAGLALVIGVRVPENAAVIGQLVAFAIVPTIVAGSAFYQALRTLPPTLVAMLATLEPVLTVALAMLLLEERFTPVQALGGSLVVTGLVWAQRSSVTDLPPEVGRP
jgi:drug/metabolite transporter (DMT)-like permease